MYPKLETIYPQRPLYDIQEAAPTARQRGRLVLVNARHRFVFGPPPELADLGQIKNYAFPVTHSVTYVAPEIVASLQRFMVSFAKIYPQNDLFIISGYRSCEKQQALYDERKQREKKNILRKLHSFFRKKELAAPGGSEHHTGLAVDFGIYHPDKDKYDAYYGSGKYAWLGKHAHEFGFVERYQKSKYKYTQIIPEPWHFRFVGQPHAELMTDLQMCLEEYLQFLGQYRQGHNHLYLSDAAGRCYEIYSTDSLKLWHRKGCSYVCSGNNQGDIIVTNLVGTVRNLGSDLGINIGKII